MTDTEQQLFAQPQAQRIWSDYMRQVETHCSLLDKRQRSDIASELKAHLLESYVQMDGDDEASRLTRAIQKLGQPQEFVPQWAEERLLDGAQPGSEIRSLFSLMRSNATKGLQQFAFSLVVGFGYLLSFYFFIMAVMKLFYPDNIGLYVAPSGIPFLGYVDADEFVELIGNWLTPIGLACAFIIQLMLSRVVRRWMHHHRQQVIHHE